MLVYGANNSVQRREHFWRGPHIVHPYSESVDLKDNGPEGLNYLLKELLDMNWIMLAEANVKNVCYNLSTSTCKDVELPMACAVRFELAVQRMLRSSRVALSAVELWQFFQTLGVEVGWRRSPTVPLRCRVTLEF